jgi:hypothetical protein
MRLVVAMALTFAASDTAACKPCEPIPWPSPGQDPDMCRCRSGPFPELDSGSDYAAFIDPRTE